jgi:hypothetical protein
MPGDSIGDAGAVTNEMPGPIVAEMLLQLLPCNLCRADAIDYEPKAEA